MQSCTEQTTLYEEAVILFSEDMTFSAILPGGENSRETPGRLVLAKFSANTFVLMVFTRIGCVASGTPFCTNMVSDDTVFDFFEKMARVHIVIDEGKSCHGVALGNTLDIRFSGTTALWQVCRIVLEVKCCLADHHSRVDAMLDSVVAAVNRAEAFA